MIVARTSTEVREILLLGVTPANLRELKAGHPIRVTAETHHGGIPEGWTIVIAFGQTERAIAEELRRAGLITDDTKVVALPRSEPGRPS